MTRFAQRHLRLKEIKQEWFTDTARRMHARQVARPTGVMDVRVSVIRQNGELQDC